MSAGEAWWLLEELPRVGADVLLELLHRQGLSYRHPLEGSIYVLDEDGSRVEASLESVLSEWTAERILTMQLWINSNTDVLTTVEAGGSRLTFDLDGLLLDEAASVVSTLLLGACLSEGTRALIVDRELPDRGDEYSQALMTGRTEALDNTDLSLLVESQGARTVKVGPRSWLREALHGSPSPGSR